jgi:hypothetical protein
MAYGPSQSNSSKLLIYGRRNSTPGTSQTFERITATEQNAVTIFAALLIADAIRAAGRLD